jgi:hypothetical protein
MQEKSPDVLQHTGLFRKLLVRSYLMLQHQVTKIIRFGDRYDFTFRLCT